MKIILKEGEEAQEFLEALINQAVDRASRRMRLLLQETNHSGSAPSTSGATEWVNTKKAQGILSIRSKKKMQQLRDESPMNGIILTKTGRTYLYCRESLHQYMKKNIIT